MHVILIAYLCPGVHNRADKCFENNIHEVFPSCFYPKVPPKSTCVNDSTSKTSEMIRARQFRTELRSAVMKRWPGDPQSPQDLFWVL